MRPFRADALSARPAPEREHLGKAAEFYLRAQHGTQGYGDTAAEVRADGTRGTRSQF
jgi:hypothetical protein